MYLYNGETYKNLDDLLTAVRAAEDSSTFQNAYDEFLSNLYPCFIVGESCYDAADTLKAVDPINYNTGLMSYIDSFLTELTGFDDEEAIEQLQNVGVDVETKIFYMEPHTGSVDTFKGWKETFEELKARNDLDLWGFDTFEEGLNTLGEVVKDEEGNWIEVNRKWTRKPPLII